MIRYLPVFLLLVAPAFAGCMTPEESTLQNDSTAAVDDLLARVWTHDASGATVALPDAFAEGFDVVAYLLGQRGAEPNVGVTSSGAVFMTAGRATMRSRDHGVTWEEVFNLSKALPQGLPGGLTGSSDPMLWVDQRTDRIFTNHMTGLLCSNMIISDDDGDTWTMKPMTCGIPVNDHQKVASAPYSNALPQPPGAVYDGVVYYCYNKLLSTNCAVSYDGGFAFEHDQPVMVRERDGCGGINGHPAPAPDGTIYVPATLGCDGPVIALSEDNGLTWTVRHGPTEFGGEEIDPDVTVTPDGTAYILWRGSDHQQYLSRSTDKFVTWDGPWKVNPAHVTSTVFAGITSGDDGRIAMAYLGTRDSTQYPQEVENTTRWNLYVTYSLDAAGAAPTFTTTQVNADEDPVQIGCVWLAGGGNPCRNMLDFIDMTSDKEGRIYVAFTDGCTVDCAHTPGATAEKSRQRDVSVAVIENGPSLVAAHGKITSTA